jgi:hypothetical protein
MGSRRAWRTTGGVMTRPFASVMVPGQESSPPPFYQFSGTINGDARHYMCFVF